MPARVQNPFLPKRSLIQWRKGPFAKIQKSVRRHADFENDGSRVKETSTLYDGFPPKASKAHNSIAELQVHDHSRAGRLAPGRENFFCESSSGWGSNIDMIALAHGAVGCGAFAQISRVNLPGFAQGVESFTALDVCTNLLTEDIDDGGDIKLERSLNEIQTLFPLARGVTILNEDPIPFINSNVKGIAKAKSQSSGKLIVSIACGVARGFNWIFEVAAALKIAAKHSTYIQTTPYDVAVPFCRTTPGISLLVSNLLHDIGLTPIHERTVSSSSEMSRVQKCRLIVGFAERFDVPADYLTEGNAQLLRRWFGIPLIWTCFLNPTATNTSLRLIAKQFGPEIQTRAEHVIAFNRKKIEAVVARYRPLLENKLVLDFTSMPEAQADVYRLLGMRVGTPGGWPGKTGVWRKPRIACDPDHPSEKSIASYIGEAKPDLVLYFKRNEYDWHKRGQSAVPFSPFFDHNGDCYWGYDGFALLAAALDRTINAPWRKLVKPPWAGDRG